MRSTVVRRTYIALTRLNLTTPRKRLCRLPAFSCIQGGHLSFFTCCIHQIFALTFFIRTLENVYHQWAQELTACGLTGDRQSFHAALVGVRSRIFLNVGIYRAGLAEKKIVLTNATR